MRQKQLNNRVADLRREQNSLRQADLKRFHDVEHLREKYDKSERRSTSARAKAEKGRVNALLQASKADAALVATRAEGTAAALAEKVETTKTAAAGAVEQTTINLVGRIKPLEDARYENAGRRGGQIDMGKVAYAVFGIVLGVIGFLLSGHIK